MRPKTTRCFLKPTPAVIVTLLLAAVRAESLVLTKLYDFSAIVSNTNTDGANPNAVLFHNNILYGTTANGGNGYGTVFRVNADGTDFTNLYSFSTPVPITNSDGAKPDASLVLSGNTLYGTAQEGGDEAAGAVFAINIDGAGFTNIHSFSGDDGYYPSAGLVVSGGILYGTTLNGGSGGYGTVFKLRTDGTEFTNLFNFVATSYSGSAYTNNNGADPAATLVLSGNKLYGTTAGGGSEGYGTVFKLNIDGTDFTNLHNFSNSDGSGPWAGLVLSGNTLYGTTLFGGAEDHGTLFRVNTDGTHFTNLYYFSELSSNTNGDGASPHAGLTMLGNTLYGTTELGGGGGCGTVFAINCDGTGFMSLYSFSGNDGVGPDAALVLSGNTLYRYDGGRRCPREWNCVRSASTAAKLGHRNDR